MNPTSERGPKAQVWAVGALVKAIDDLMAARLGTVRVAGEISALTQATSGHRYFNLKDAQGQQALLKCAFFRRAAAQLGFALREGLKVEAVGRLTVYEPRGDLQFVVESVHLVGAGSLHEEFLRLKARLAAEGWFDSERKRALPAHPRSIGVVSSLGAAALRDVLTVVARRAPHVRVVVYPCLVQGEAAVPTIVSALDEAAQRSEVDALILARGGGSLEDLWAFNDERVVKAVVRSPVPIVCGVGHETDVTLSDFAADVRAATPTAAAELLTPVRDDELQVLDQQRRRLQLAAQRALDRQAQRLDQLGLLVLRPAQALTHQARRLDQRQSQLVSGLVGVLQQRSLTQERLARRLMQAHSLQMGRHAMALRDLSVRLQSQDPSALLRRGYAWISGEGGQPLTSARSIEPGQAITAVWHDGRARARVEDIELAYNAEPSNHPPA